MTDQELFDLNGVTTLARGDDGPAVRHGGWMPTPFGALAPNVSEYTSFADPPPIAGDEVFLWEAIYRALGDKYPPWNWQLTGSCFPAGVSVRMADGSEKPVEAVSVGDRVRSHTGKGRSVTDTMTRNYTGELITVAVRTYAFPIQATADHPFAVWRDDELVWVDATDLQEGDNLILSGGGEETHDEVLDVSEAIPDIEYTRSDKKKDWFDAAGLDTNERVGRKRTHYDNHVLRRIPVTASLARLIGLYLAEGGCHAGRVVFTFNRKELHYAEEVIALIRGCFGVEAEIELQESHPTACKVRCQNLNLALVLSWLCPGNVYTKRVPAVFMRAPETVRSALLRGWLDGDGHVKDVPGNGLGITGVSVCPELIRDMHSIAVSLGLICSVHCRPARNQSRQSYGLHLTDNRAGVLVGVAVANPAIDYDARRVPPGRLAKIKSVTRETVTELPVYDFTVEEDHSFVANGLIVHNCVQGGYNNCLKVVMGQEIISRPEPEAYVTPFTFHTYGLSRYLGFGATSEGEGSFGLAMARAGEEGGFLPIDDPQVDKPHICGPAEVYDAPTELKWSSVRNHPSGLVDRSKKFTVKYIRCRNKEQALDHLRRRHPLTFAGDWGGQGSGVVKGAKYPVLTMPRRETWNHQQSCLAYWANHPELRINLWEIHQQWWNPGTTKYTMNGRSIWKITQPGEAKPMHGEHPPITAEGWKHPPFPRGGYWITDADMEYQCRVGEVAALVIVDGITGREIGAGNI